MSNLAYSAAPWAQDDSTVTRRQRPSFRKTVRAPRRPEAVEDMPGTTQGVELDQAFLTGASNKSSGTNGDERVQRILNAMADADKNGSFRGDNDASGLVNFRPPPYPEMTKQPVANTARDGVSPPPAFESSGLKFRPPPNYLSAASGSGAGANAAPPMSKLGAARDLGMYTNYRQAHQFPLVPGSSYTGPSGGNAGSIGFGGGAAESTLHTILEKINQVVHAVENMQMEKTNYALEESILYCYLGIFIIFVCDSFHRLGRSAGR